MKTLKLLTLALAAFAITSCGNDDDGVGQLQLTDENLEGTHSYTFVEVVSDIVTQVQGVDVSSTITKTGDSFDGAAITFNTDGTYTLSGAYREVTVVNVEGQAPQESTQIINLDGESGNYTFDNSARTITLDDTEYNVFRFTTSELILRYTEELEEESSSSSIMGELRFSVGS